jgi:putative glutamine amidotransferase
VTSAEPRRYRALIAVVAYHLARDRVARWPDGGYGVPAPYLEALRRAGARTAIVSPGEEGDPEELLEPFDGLLLVGGGDDDPARYGADPDIDHNYGVEPDRDAFEIALVRAADRLHLPTLCICRGMQIMNVLEGGTLYQHLHPKKKGTRIDHRGRRKSTHSVQIMPGTRLADILGTREVKVISNHHQAIRYLAPGFVPSAVADDGTFAGGGAMALVRLGPLCTRIAAGTELPFTEPRLA